MAELLVLDSWRVLEWLKARDPRASRMDWLIDQARAGRLHLVMSTNSLGEVYYNSLTVWGERRADAIYSEFQRLPISVIHPTADDALKAARIKGRFKVAYAGAFATVPALEFNAPVVSGDPDFLKLRDSALIEVEWVGK